MTGKSYSSVTKNYVVRKIRTAFLLINKPVWDHFPTGRKFSRIYFEYGKFLHSIVLRRAVNRSQNPGTYLLRNRPQLELIQNIVSSKDRDKAINIAVLGCSVGMEVYSIVWQLKSIKQKVNIIGLELSEKSLSIAKKGEYPLDKYDWHFERLSEEEYKDFFTIKNEVACISPELKHDIKWVLGNACDPEISKRIGLQDIVLANQFMCHMYPNEAVCCLENIKNLVASDGYLFVSGLDLNVREKVMDTPDFEIVRDKLREIHNGDSSMHAGWPWQYWGLEPIPENYEICIQRYAMVYKRLN
ncbi:MAG: CheR family methyltransferase [Gammaproteobacteria bacterium]|nr:CheR family methyltransferase [Gammaproteobacteria bacterium]